MVNGFTTRLGALALFALVSVATGSARAEPAASDWFVTDQGRVRLIAGTETVGTADQVRLGLEFDLKPHWKIYWRSPGDAGYPPQLDWAGSDNLAAAKISWPAPMRFSVLGLETVGYEGRVVLPIAATLTHAGAALQLKAALRYLTCSDICVPYEASFALALPAGPDAPSAHAATIARFAALEPRRQQTPALSIRSARAIPGKPEMLELRVVADPPLAMPDVFVEGSDAVAFGVPRLVSAPGASEAVLLVPAAGAAQAGGLVGKKLTVTLVDGERALEAAVMPVPGEAGSDTALWLRILGIAVLGGFILNFMPCVLPVLALKLASVAGAAGRERRHLRLGFLASAAGVIASFLALAIATVALKAAGMEFGWGIQFQQPLFLIFMMALLTLFAANLWSLYEVPLPGAAAEFGAERRGVHWSSFAAGAFATLLATPCSAPFLGTAIGFALASSGAATMLIFLALGVGLTAPYLLIAAAPRLIAWLPRPGRWMVLLRRVLGVALAATALWLAFVLAAESGVAIAATVALLMAAVPVMLYALRRFQARVAVAAAIVALAFLVPAALPAPQPPVAVSAGDLWQPFDPGAIERLVADGRTVFVDVTADWCLTCKLNERLAIDTAPVRTRLGAKDVVAMRADWTRPDPAIARYLRGFGRYGIPFNAVYGPALPQGRALPELLTPGEVADAIDQSRKGG
jgi:suppressor for copper-sensitivity B